MRRFRNLAILVVATTAANLAHAQINGVELVSVSSAGVPANDNSSGWISRDGSVVLLLSTATNLIPNDGNWHLNDVFIRDLNLGTTTVASVNYKGFQTTSGVLTGRMSATGRDVIYATSCMYMISGGTNGWQHAYVHDRDTGQIDILSLNATASKPTAPVQYSPCRRTAAL